MSQIYRRGAVSPRINMTPLIDVTFLLIIFFMLVNTIISDETVEMVVPKLTEAQTIEVGDIKRLVINVAPTPYGKERFEEGAYLMYEGTEGGMAVEVQLGQKNRYAIFEMDKLSEELVKSKDKAKETGEKIEIMLRADSALRFDQVEPVIGAISKAGIGVINMVAFLPGEGPFGDGLGEEVHDAD